MNLTITDPWVEIPAAAAYCATGVLISIAFCDKVDACVEYALIKKFGDYDHPQKTLDDKLFISMDNKYFYAKNITLGSIAAAVFSAAYP